MTLYSLPPFIGSIATLILGFIIYRKNGRHSLNRLFLLLSICFFVWNFGVFLLYTDLPEAKAVLTAKIVHIAVIWAPVFFLNLVLIILTIQKRFFLPFLYSLTSILSILTLTRLMIKGVFKISYAPEVSAFFAQAGPLYPLFFTYMVCVVLYAIWNLWQALKRSTGLKKAQIKYLLLGFMFATVGFNDMLPILGIQRYPLMNASVYTFGSISIIFWNLIIAYAIYKHHLMDINIVIKKGAVYAYLSFMVLVPCMIGIILAQRHFFGQANPFFSFLVFCALLLTALLFIKFKPEIEEHVEKTLFRRKYEYKKTLSELGKIIISFLDEKELFDKASEVLSKDLGIEKISLFLLDREKKAYTLLASQNLGRSPIKDLRKDDPFLKWLKKGGKGVVKEELERVMGNPRIKQVVERLDSMESEVCIPLMRRDELIGIINLGSKESGEMYSHEDLDLLAHFASQAAVALENARLYQDLKKTQLLMRRSERLAALGSLTAGLAHEIRNPLVAVKTFLDLLPERYEDEEFRGNFLRLTTSEVERITALVSELLNFARPSKPQLAQSDVNEVLEKVMHLVTVEAKTHDITIHSDLQKTPQAMIDEEQMKQVFLNLFLNAMEAISSHGTISVTTRGIQKNGMEYVQVEIADTGKGIPQEIIDRIFDPFFTTKEKGSGLGLSICHQIIQEHNGYIEVESRLGEGTVFSVNLPL